VSFSLIQFNNSAKFINYGASSPKKKLNSVSSSSQFINSVSVPKVMNYEKKQLYRQQSKFI